MKFWLPCQSFFARNHECLLEIQKSYKWSPLRKKSSKCSSEFWECSFDYLARVFLLEILSSARNPKKLQMKFVEKRIIKLCIRTCKMQFWQPCWNFSVNSTKINSARNAKIVLVLFPSQKNLCNQDVFQTRRMQFWQTYRKFFHRSRSTFSMSSEKKIRKPIFFLRTCISQFSHPCRSFSDKSSEVSR